MAKPLKTAGLEELAVFRARVNRQLSLGRISRPDHNELIEMVDGLEAKVVAMEEDLGESDPYG